MKRKSKEPVIKLVASDMDGTLLNSQKEMTEFTAKTLKRLRERGVYFAAASGRQYYNLVEVFRQKGMEKNMAFIAENGTLVVEDDEIIFVDQLKDELVAQVVQAARPLKNIYPVLCGANAAYIEDDDPRLKFQVEKYFARREKTSDLLSVLQKDKIVKIAVLEANAQAESRCYPVFEAFRDQAQVLLAGPEWVDVINYSASKGTALKLIAERHGAAFDEIMAFGDYLNDADMMTACKYSFAMKNAHPDLKKKAANICGSNDEDGVAQVLTEWFDLAQT